MKEGNYNGFPNVANIYVRFIKWVKRHEKILRHLLSEMHIDF